MFGKLQKDLKIIPLFMLHGMEPMSIANGRVADYLLKLSGNMRQLEEENREDINIQAAIEPVLLLGI